MEKKKGIVSEFKEFIMRGNVIDMAVGVIIGSTFTKIVTSLVNDIFMPVIGALFGGIDFNSLKYVIRPADEAAGVEEAAILYGSFIQNVVNFILVALVVFLIVKGINAVRRKKEEPAPAPEEGGARPRARARARTRALRGSEAPHGDPRRPQEVRRHTKKPRTCGACNVFTYVLAPFSIPCNETRALRIACDASYDTCEP